MKISIITPTFNSQHFFKVGPWWRSGFEIEHIIIDGGSTDDTLSIINSYSKSVDYDVKIISEPDNGVYDALNKGVSKSTGDIVGILHSDDLYAYDDVLNDVIKIFEREKVDSCYGDLCYVSRNNPSKIIRYWKSGEYNIDKFKSGWMPPHPTFFVRKEIYEKYGLFDTSYKISADYELMVRFLYKHKISSFYINRVMIKMRIGGKSNKIANLFDKLREDYDIIIKYNLGGIKTLFMKNLQKIPQFFKVGL